MLPAPRQKQPQISPIFISNKVTLHISREKDGKFRLVCAGWDDTKVVQPDGCGQARRGWKGGAYPLAREAAPPPQKLGPPLGPPWFFQLGCAAHVHGTVHFSPSFLRSRYG
jgi:hypothetical protein